MPAPRSLVASALVVLLASALPVGAARADGDKPHDDPIVELLAHLKDDQPADVRLAALKEAAGTDDARLLPPLGKLLKAPEEDVRLATVATLAARTMPDTKKRAASLLLERSKTLQAAFEKDVSRKDELVAVVKGLHDLAQETTIDGLLDGIELGVDLAVVEARAMAVANVPSAKAIEGLIDYMGRRHRDGSGIRGVLAKALAYATGTKQANDVDAWRAWWKDAKATFDFQAAAAARASARDAKTAKDAAKKAATDAKPKRKKGETTPPKDGEKPANPEKPADGEKPAEPEQPNEA
ncbi:MAG: HEAT repeat domain-containing protein [Planctomycetota bacterium]